MKKLLHMLLALALALGLSACGGGQQSATSGSNPGNTSTIHCLSAK